MQEGRPGDSGLQPRPLELRLPALEEHGGPQADPDPEERLPREHRHLPEEVLQAGLIPRGAPEVLRVRLPAGVQSQAGLQEAQEDPWRRPGRAGQRALLQAGVREEGSFHYDNLGPLKFGLV